MIKLIDICDPTMSAEKPELKLTKKLPTDLGRKYAGHVAVGNHKIPITYREPNRADKAVTAYVNANGLSAGRGTMRTPARQAITDGYRAVTLDYTNRWLTGALDANARDVAAAMDALALQGLNVRGLGLSEGGRVMSRALALVKNRVQAATFVASAGYIANNNLSWGQGVKRLSAAGPEIGKMSVKHPRAAIHMGISCMRNCTSRPLGVIGEMNELRKGDEHQTLIDLKAVPDSTLVRFAYGIGDMLLQAERQVDGIQGLPFDDIFAYEGQHCDVTTNPAISQEIYRRDERIVPQQPVLPIAA